MNFCIMLNLDYYFLCTYLKLFEFELVFEFDLKSIEKIKRKAIRNSREEGKPNLAHQAHLGAASRARARIRPFMKGGPRLSASFRRGHAHDRAFPGHAPTRPSLFCSPHTLIRPPPLSCALSRTSLPSLSLCART
jgi:hypothetical protein